MVFVENEKQFRRIATSIMMLFPKINCVTYSLDSEHGSIDLWKGEDCYCNRDGVWMHRQNTSLWNQMYRSSLNCSNRPKYKLIDNMACSKFSQQPFIVRRTEINMMQKKQPFCQNTNQLKDYFLPLKNTIKFNSLKINNYNFIDVITDNGIYSLNLRGSGFHTPFRGVLQFN